MKIKLVIGQWIHIDGKFTLESNFQQFSDSHFTSVLCHEFPIVLDSRNFSNFMWNHAEIDKFLSHDHEKKFEIVKYSKAYLLRHYLLSFVPLFSGCSAFPLFTSPITWLAILFSGKCSNASNVSFVPPLFYEPREQKEKRLLKTPISGRWYRAEVYVKMNITYLVTTWKNRVQGSW